MGTKAKLTQQPHRRWNPLKQEWIIVSPHRTQRPWQGAEENSSATPRPAHDPHCYLCPGTTRANGEKNANYAATYVFTNDFQALLPNDETWQMTDDDLLQAHSLNGTCRVLCFSPRHDLTLAQMSEADIMTVIDTWTQQATELGQSYRWVQLFENKGAIMGCSNPHPHGQIWASDFLPNEIQREDQAQQSYFATHHHSLLTHYVEQEITQQQRIVCENDDWLVVVPFWATWPFETLLLPKLSVHYLQDLTSAQRKTLATILKSLLQKYDALFNISFPYSMGWHTAPYRQENIEHWLLHAHFYPPLLRSASVKKFMVGYELLAESQRDITPEQAAECLRNC